MLKEALDNRDYREHGPCIILDLVLISLCLMTVDLVNNGLKSMKHYHICSSLLSYIFPIGNQKIILVTKITVVET